MLNIDKFPMLMCKGVARIFTSAVQCTLFLSQQLMTFLVIILNIHATILN